MSARPPRKIVALGGGHGLAATLQAIHRDGNDVTAVVSVADDGGSSGRLRATFDIPAPGDLRRCLVALAGDPLWARAFDHRFRAGELDGHAFGNLVITGLTDVTGDFRAALDAAARLLAVDGRVLPATDRPVALKARVAGHDVVGQAQVATSGGGIEGVSIIPPDARAPAEVVEAITEADLVVIGPGSLFTSVLAACVVPDIAAALAAREGGRVYVCNLGAELHETDGFTAMDHLRVLLAHGVPVDVMVHDAAMPLDTPAHPGADTTPAHPPTRVVSCHVARPDGLAHDPARLGDVLATLS